jgi:hypothetical protein
MTEISVQSQLDKRGIPSQRIGTLQIDLDGAWAIANRFGVSLPIRKDPIFMTGMLNCLDLLSKLHVKATFLVVGMDLKIPWKKKLIARAFDEGHELANHTMSHFPDLRSRERKTKFTEIDRASHMIEELIGVKPKGFKSSGYQADPSILLHLAERNYAYDSSILPTYVLSLLRWVEAGKSHRQIPSYSSIRDSLGRILPYIMTFSISDNSEMKNLLEIPPTVIPVVKIPFHGSFVSNLGRGYFDLAFTLVQAMSPFLNYVLHLKDLAKPNIIPGVPSHQTKPIPPNVLEHVATKITEAYKLARTADIAYSLS